MTADVFLKLWQQPERWNPALGQLSSWLLTITRNAAIDRLRREARHQASDWPAEADERGAVTGADMGPPGRTGNCCAICCSNCRPTNRVIELAFYRGYTHSELAEGLGMQLGHCQNTLHTGMQKLHALWEQATNESSTSKR